MAEVVGFDKSREHLVTCGGCGAIVKYIKAEVQTRRYTCMGDPSGHDYVRCPNCGDDARIRSW